MLVLLVIVEVVVPVLRVSVEELLSVLLVPVIVVVGMDVVELVPVL